MNIKSSNLFSSDNIWLIFNMQRIPGHIFSSLSSSSSLCLCVSLLLSLSFLPQTHQLPELKLFDFFYEIIFIKFLNIFLNCIY